MKCSLKCEEVRNWPSATVPGRQFLSPGKEEFKLRSRQPCSCTFLSLDVALGIKISIPGSRKLSLLQDKALEAHPLEGENPKRKRLFSFFLSRICDKKS